MIRKLLVALFNIFGIKICLILQLWKLNYEQKVVVLFSSLYAWFTLLQKVCCNSNFSAFEYLTRFKSKKEVNALTGNREQEQGTSEQQKVLQFHLMMVVLQMYPIILLRI